MQLALPSARYDKGQKITAFFEELVQRVEALPGVRRATVARTLPTLPYQLIALQVAEQPTVPFAERPLGEMQTITVGYFETLGIPLRRGRQFTEQDFKAERPLLMVNESLARRFWPGYPNGQDPVGLHVQLGQSTFPVEIIGIAADVHEAGLANEVVPEVYLAARLSPPQTAYLAVQTHGNPLDFASSIRSQVSAVDRDQAIGAIQTMDELVEASLGQRRFTMTLLAAFASVALLLAVVGIYGMVAYSVVQRTREVGIRRALGAQHSDILKLVIGQGLGLTLAGVFIGLGGALALRRVMGTFLFQIRTTDAVTFVEIGLLLILVAVIACYIPARKASRVDPMCVLRS
jgi:predicted permease